jgi:hypothetical protein
MKNEYNDLPTEEIIGMMQDLSSKGFACFVKWVCEACGERVTCNEPNIFFTEGYTHEEKGDGSPCGHTSFPDKFGLMVMTRV